MELTICYNDNCSNFKDEMEQLINEKFSDINIISYNEFNYKERSKAYKIKGGFGARMTPFMVLQEDKKYIRAFYSEDNSCNINNLINFLNEYSSN